MTFSWQASSVPQVIVQKGIHVRIVDVKAYPLSCALGKPFAYSQKWFRSRTALLIKVTTDEGIVGWGEAFCHDAWPALIAMIEQVYKPLLIDKDPLAREVIWDTLYNWTRDYGQKGAVVIALSGIDIALWDIVGKAAGLPIHTLLGGPFRDRVQAYATGLYVTEEALRKISVLADEAATYVQEGFRAIKMKIGFGPQRDSEFVRAVRHAIGSETMLMVDANHAYDAATAIAVGHAIEKHNVAWFEEPVIPENLAGYRAVRRAINIPIAGGEAEFTRYGFRELVSRGAVDILQPDLCSMGGISEGWKVAAMAAAWGVRCMPHVWGTGVALAAALHFIAALPPQPPSLNADGPMLELDRTENPLRDLVLRDPLQLVDCYALVPQGVGLGVEVDEEQVKRFGPE
jgi:D-galactarolactone cycloisomerase